MAQISFHEQSVCRAVHRSVAANLAAKPGERGETVDGGPLRLRAAATRFFSGGFDVIR